MILLVCHQQNKNCCNKLKEQYSSLMYGVMHTCGAPQKNCQKIWMDNN